MKPQITRFKINNLFGYLSFDIPFEDNKLILVADNGAGKTMVLQLMAYFLGQQWAKLMNFEYEYDSIECTLDDQVYLFDRNKLRESSKDIIPFIDLFVEANPVFPVDFIEDVKLELTANNLFELADNQILLNDIASHYEYDENWWLEITTELIKVIFSSILKIEPFDLTVMYLPTYRRIEKGLGKLLPSLENRVGFYLNEIKKQLTPESFTFDEDELAFENIKLNDDFQLDDSEFSFENNDHYKDPYSNRSEIPFDTKEIFNNLASIKDVLKEVLYSQNNETGINSNTVHDSYFELAKFGMNDTIELINKCIEDSKTDEGREEAIYNFIRVCNRYFLNKKLNFDDSILTIELDLNGKLLSKPIEFLNHLSSGEKQIISIFGYLNLSGKNNFAVIFDEPELSISIDWQKKLLLDIVNSENTYFSLTATHSPFTFETQDDYFFYLDEFIKK